MRPYPIPLALLLTLSLGVMSGGRVARAETTNCTPVTAAPSTIGTPGVYCLTHNVTVAMATGVAIDVTASDVVFDLNGFSLRNSFATGPDTASGIRVSGTRRVTIRNGTVRGFFAGVEILGVGPLADPAPTGHIVEDLRVMGSGFSGISITLGNGDVVRNNLVLNTGSASASGAFGILVNQKTRVLNNDVGLVQATTSAYGISAGNGSVVMGNRITQVGQGVQCGTGGAEPTRVLGNVVILASVQTYDFAGLCQDNGGNIE